MHAGKLVFAQVMEFAPWHTFRRLVGKYRGDFHVRSLMPGPVPVSCLRATVHGSQVGPMRQLRRFNASASVERAGGAFSPMWNSLA